MNYTLFYGIFFVLSCLRFGLSVPRNQRSRTNRFAQIETRQTSPSIKKSSATIANEMCEIYKKARFVNKTIIRQIPGEKEIVYSYMDCVKIKGLIIGGEPAKLKEFPHMALVGFGNDIKNIIWRCGGTLISNRFVLSAAHCSSQRQKPKWIRLGELNIDIETEASHKDFRIIAEFPHPAYVKGVNYHDIILYKLHTIVQFSVFIRPLCLYTSSMKLQETTKVLITGWGQTAADEQSSSKLLKAIINIIDENECQNTYESPAFPNGFNSSIALCAGDFTDGKDTCQGDSGGPLQVPLEKETCMYAQVGITSTGHVDCGDRSTPAVYTSIPFYLDWIQSIVWPQ